MLGFCAARISYDESRTWRNDPAISDITINQHLVARSRHALGSRPVDMPRPHRVPTPAREALR